MDIFKKLWWKFVPGKEINIPWPYYLIQVKKGHPLWLSMFGPDPQYVSSNDPNDFYRNWLEKNVGRQGIDWDWKFMPMHSMFVLTNRPEDNDYITIKFRKGKEKYASLFLLTQL